MLGVVLVGELPIGSQEARGPDLKPPTLEAPEDLSREPSLHRIRLDQDERAFGGHRRESNRLLLAHPPPATCFSK